jgi:Tfp pilus assembly protein PilZ
VFDPPNLDRRSTLRYQYELPVALRLLRDPTLRLASLSRDISAGGIFLYSDARLPVGEEVAITLKLPRQGTKTRLLGIGRVVRVEQRSQGLGLAVTIERCELF